MTTLAVDNLMEEYSMRYILHTMADRASWYAKRTWQLPAHVTYWNQVANVLRTAAQNLPVDDDDYADTAAVRA